MLCTRQVFIIYSITNMLEVCVFHHKLEKKSIFFVKYSPSNQTSDTQTRMMDHKIAICNCSWNNVFCNIQFVIAAEIMCFVMPYSFLFLKFSLIYKQNGILGNVYQWFWYNSKFGKAWSCLFLNLLNFPNAEVQHIKEYEV